MMKHLLRVLGCAALISAMSIQASAASIAWFQTDALGATETSSPVTVKDANVTVGDLTEGPGLVNYGWTTSLAVRNHDLTADLATAVAADDYFSFTVTPDAGYAVNYDTVGLFIDLNGASTPTPNAAATTDLTLTSDVDGFGTALATVTAVHDDGVGGTTHNALSMNLGAALQGITAPVEFRLYLNNPTGSPNGLGIGWIFNAASIDDDVHVQGSVVQIPEPSTLCLLALSGLALVLRRRS